MNKKSINIKISLVFFLLSNYIYPYYKTDNSIVIGFPLRWFTLYELALKRDNSLITATNTNIINLILNLIIFYFITSIILKILLKLYHFIFNR